MFITGTTVNDRLWCSQLVNYLTIYYTVAKVLAQVPLIPGHEMVGEVSAVYVLLESIY